MAFYVDHMNQTESTRAQDFLREVGHRSYGTILADPPWRFTNRTGKVASEHRRLLMCWRMGRGFFAMPDTRRY